MENLHSIHSTNITIGGMRPTTKSHLLTKLIKVSVCSTSDFSTWLSSSIDASKVSLSSSSRENTELTNPGRNLYLSYNIFDADVGEEGWGRNVLMTTFNRHYWCRTNIKCQYLTPPPIRFSKGLKLISVFVPASFCIWPLFKSGFKMRFKYSFLIHKNIIFSFSNFFSSMKI